ncbi:MAG: acyltransferase [Paludibacteraceae bacterium]|nr:acyltransferase [Paludibacteraceae bacterium]
MKKTLSQILSELFLAVQFCLSAFRGKHFSKVKQIYYGAELKLHAKHSGCVRIKSKPTLSINGELILGDNFIAGHHLRIDLISELNGQCFSPQLIIGDNVSIEDFCHIGCISKISIGDGTLIASNVYIADHFHGDGKPNGKSPIEKPLTTKGEVSIGKNVWIGEQVCILPGVSIGDNCIIGAGSIVTKSFPDNSVIVGVPGNLLSAK